MKAKAHIVIVLIAFLMFSCSQDKTDDPISTISDPKGLELYFPPLSSDTWEAITIEDLGWNDTAVEPLYNLLEDKNTKAFIVLKDGRIAIEKYFGNFTQDSLWYWASAGKTLTGFTVGIAQEQELLNINDKTSDYLNQGWTSTTLEQENKITVRNQLTMTSGLKDNLLTFDCVTPICLLYEADAQTRWAYHNGPYTLLQSVVANAAGVDFQTYFNAQLRDKIGMNGIWVPVSGANVYFSNPRSMARFGLLNLNSGKWDDEVILTDSEYLTNMKNTSQELNKSYGYLWWLNGKEDYMVPGSQMVFNGTLIPNAPADTYAGLGKNDQKLYVVPSKGLVIVRMGEDTGSSLLGPSSFDNELWGKINALIN